MGEAPTRVPWSMDAQQVVAQLGGRSAGLSVAEARARLEQFGPNELAPARQVGGWEILLRQFVGPLVFILLLAAVVTLALGDYADAAVIGAVLTLNALIGFTQEYRAERSMEALGRLARTTARAIRDGREHALDAAALVPGDIVLIEAGVRVPADCRVIHATALQVDESLLTGESTTVTKDPVSVPADAVVADRTSMVFMGSIVTSGNGRAIVTATGSGTELGKVAGAVSALGEVQTPLQRRMSRFARVVGLAVLAAAALGMVLGAAVGEDLGDLFLSVVALAVSAIPEGLPVVLTIALAISVRRMVARHVIIRSLPAVEALGSCTVIGSDKTGTLTENRMTVQRIHAGGRDYEVLDAGEGAIRTEAGDAVDLGSDDVLRELLLAGALCNNAAVLPFDAGMEAHGDPTEIALLVAAAAAGIDKDDVDERLPRVEEIPFDSQRRFAASFNRIDERVQVSVKGAPEVVIEMCRSAEGGALDRHGVLEQADRFAGEGLRVLAIAATTRGDPPWTPSFEVADLPTGLSFLGLVGMLDPPRPEAAEAIRDCERAGIRVLMITGDHAATAQAIGRRLGIGGASPEVVTGRELDGLDDAGFAEVVQRASIYARVSPQHKLRIVSTLREVGETVAVTGDGVNDAPALKAADIGAAMGRAGTDVAKEAADLIVTDDNFASIVAAVHEGRVAFDNIRKTTFFLISSGLAEVLAVLASIVLPFRLPFLPAQLLWLNLVTNGVQDVALAFEPGEPDVMRRSPRPRAEGVISRMLWVRTAIVGVVMGAGTLLLFLLELRASDDIDRARTVAVTTMVVFQVLHVGNCRSESRSAFSKSPFANPFLFVGTTLAVALHVAAMHWSATQALLRLEPLDAATWARIVAVGLTVVLAVEAHKLIVRRRGPATSPPLP